MNWNEGLIARAIARQTLASKCVVLVDRCTWTGHECDVLAVTRDLRIIDIEVKISRADLKADARKDKWWHRHISGYEVVKTQWGQSRQAIVEMQPLSHPRRVWKHYYAMPAEIWKPELLACLPSTASGVILMREQRGGGAVVAAEVVRRATPDKNAYRLKPEDVIDIARLANLRMWDAYAAGQRTAALEGQPA